MSKITNINATMLTTESLTAFLLLIAQIVRQLSEKAQDHQFEHAFRARLKISCETFLEQTCNELGLQDSRDCKALLNLQQSLEELFDSL